ncbi:hypothetical protein [Alistipes indistinctus]|jgi:hypothetical protein|uniref:hypothetical protein n=1 Tax=Alistipes indistinctus TaxID=626932 RepID=UPI00216AB8FC|nr:hypothetical protein [Alistipes indistinctus]
MHKLLIAAMALCGFASCTKVNDDPTPPVTDGEAVTVSFVSEPATRAFFDATAAAEA